MIRVRFRDKPDHLPVEAVLGTRTVMQTEYYTDDSWYEEGRNHRTYCTQTHVLYTRTIDVPAYFMEFKSAEEVLDYIQCHYYILSYIDGEYVFLSED